MNRTSIEWTDLSANPLRFRDASGRVVWGCAHASPGCVNCYAETLARRFDRGGPFNVPTVRTLTPFLDADELRRMRTARRVGGREVSGAMVFVCDMTDVFGEWVPDALLDELFSVFADRRDATWQVLTKRADRMRDYLAARAPLPNVWLGVSVESAAWTWRIDALRETPAAIRFVSFEPVIADVGAVALDGIDWAIVGGESGPRSRPFDLAWARDLLRQCRAQGVAPFVKQVGSRPVAASVPLRLVSRMGGDMAEWPEELRVREWPVCVREAA